MTYQERRKKHLTQHLAVKKPGLELGPLCWPVLKSPHIEYVDHIDTAGLREKYKDDPGITPEEIVEVTYALDGKPLSTAVGSKKFHFVIASHVIEHVPDVISWLQDVSSVLVEGGKFALAIPDKRYTFDITREPSGPGDVIGPYLEKDQRPHSSVIFNSQYDYRTGINPGRVWHGETYVDNGKKRKYSLRDAYQLCLDNLAGTYIDAHTTVYTPYSFTQIMKALIELELTDFVIEKLHQTETEQYEFLVILRKASKMKLQDRLRTIPRIKAPKPYRELEKLLEEQLVINTHLSNEIRDIKSSRSWAAAQRLKKAARPVKKIVRTIKC